MKNRSGRTHRRPAAVSGARSVGRTDFLELFPVSDTVQGGCSSGGKVEQRADANYVAARSSINQLYDVISNFDETKRGLVRSIGFEGMLSFPPIRHINRRFAVWLMSRVDPLSQTLVLDESRKIKFCKDDVALVFGIPSKGRCVSDSGRPRKDVGKKILCSFLGISEKESRSIKAALEVIERDYRGSMSESEQNAFKVAFVIYLMSTLLSPGAKYDYATVEYWNALVDPSEIHMYDWSQFVTHRLFDAVVEVKSDLRVNSKVASITGCCLFLQVFYLDSIDLGVLNLPHSTFPRVSHFNADLMKSMVMADSINGPDDSSELCYGKSQLRPASEV